MVDLTFPEMLLRVLLAFVAGFAVGWERESHGRAAGLRTTILACLASAVAMIISQVMFVASMSTTASGSWRPDPARLGAGVLAGIGFLGAGTILRHENTIRGVTTAASLWFVTVMGLTIGLGQFALGLTCTGLALATLFLLPELEKYIRSDSYATLTVTTQLEGIEEADLRERIRTFGPMVKHIRLRYDLEKKQRTAVYELKLKKTDLFTVSTKMVASLAGYPGVVQVDWA
jgi:putative Mg2+ transporter-C (MgtC) family protein